MTVRTSSSGPENPVASVVVGLVLLLIVGGIAFFGMQRQAQDRAAQATWPAVTATVTEAGWQNFDDKRHVGDNLTGYGLHGPYEYVPILRYRYAVAGASHTGLVAFRAHDTKGTNAQRDARGIVARYPVGFQFVVRYDPKRPGESVPAQKLS